MSAPTDLPAAVAEAHGTPALVDKDGCIWVDLGRGWSYLSEHTTVSWDVHDRLPAMYEPYRPLDAAATALALSVVAASAAR